MFGEVSELKEAAYAIVGWSCTAMTLLILVLGVRLARRRSKPIVRNLTALAIGLAGLPLAVMSGGALSIRYRSPPARVIRQVRPGIEYRRTARQTPRPLVLHVLRVELETPGLTFTTTAGTPGRCVPALETSTYAEQTRADVAINTHYFYRCKGAPSTDRMVTGAPVMPIGVSISDGRDLVTKPWNGSTLYIDDAGRASLGTRPDHALYAISGRYRLLEHGEPSLTGAPVTDVNMTAPRVALGLDSGNTTLIIAVVDGRQPGYSEGMRLDELAALMLELGAVEAIELDGGGSATMVVRDDEGVSIVNSPIHQRIVGRERPVAAHLGIRATNAE